MPALSLSTTETQTTVATSGWAKQTLMFGAGIQLAMFFPSLVAWFFDDRLVNDINVWDKPIKFEFSIFMMIVTVILLLPLLNDVQRASRSVRWSAWAIAFFGMIEIFYIVVQSARGRASHFNYSTPLEAIAYPIMGIGAISMVVGCFFIGLAIWRAKPQASLQGLWLGAALGLMVGAVLTAITAGLMSSGQITAPGHWVGGIRSDAQGLFLLGWATQGGDLRVPHFFATHLMQALPILGLLADRFTPASAKTIVWGGLALGIIVVVATFAQAMSGMPFLAL